MWNFPSYLWYLCLLRGRAKRDYDWFFIIRELCSTQSRKLDQLEEENVRLENQLEQKQLDWETRDVELEELQVIWIKRYSEYEINE